MGFVWSWKERPGLVHRLDKDTSGVMVIAKTDESPSLLFSSNSNITPIHRGV